MCLAQIVFYSHNRVAMTGGSMRDMVRDILASCSRYDHTTGITGTLIFNEAYFLQAMEGDRAAISEQLWRLAEDDRQSGMVLLFAGAIDRRDFEGWTVGFAGHTPALDALYLLHGTQAKLDPPPMTARGAVGLLRAVSHLDGTHYVQKSTPLAGAAREPARRPTA
ncbi:hypothetical protein ASG40_00780 [Methylobacterium sp. Leaf399]|uniref:BLUF domain-containing protein n=1 Tax=unclassified Methylobacterium TaxID=2615210 RepID=UPI0006FF9E78|nr:MULTISPECIES: BLUF domain-containing protein [unclassified Methylobacterium]KQP61269.1 hypothetical protein ASF39_00780 [Methylobacterium sp. Leaf108]KQT19421.1 hypothetical protein ASG40_00780 [Methylobacterium sp. Leaf399]KQT78180.1 hypothetical protein ASG59_09330 [Methylobacterium sp. Leaf466]